MLHHACRYGHSEIVELLVQNGANVNSEDNNFLTPLHYAARYNADNSSLKVENFVVSKCLFYEFLIIAIILKITT